MKLDDLNERQKEIIAEYFSYSFDFDFLDIVADVVGGLEDVHSMDELTDALYYEIDRALIYNSDKWTVAQHYTTTPENLEWDDIMLDFYEDCEEIARRFIEASQSI